MSAGSREEVLIRSLIEGLCMLMSRYYGDKPRQKAKWQATQELAAAIDVMLVTYPITLSDREFKMVRAKVEQFGEAELALGDNANPEVMLSMLMALVDHLASKVSHKNGKAGYVAEINDRLMELYDCFDRKCNKFDMMEMGAKLAEGIWKQNQPGLSPANAAESLKSEA